MSFQHLPLMSKASSTSIFPCSCSITPMFIACHISFLLSRIHLANFENPIVFLYQAIFWSSWHIIAFNHGLSNPSWICHTTPWTRIASSPGFAHVHNTSGSNHSNAQQQTTINSFVFSDLDLLMYQQIFFPNFLQFNYLPFFDRTSLTNSSPFSAIIPTHTQALTQTHTMIFCLLDCIANNNFL